MKSGKSIRILILAVIATAAGMLLCSCNPYLPVNPKYSYSSFELELGEPISGDIGEYVDLSSMSPEDAEFARENTIILYDGKDINELDRAETGDHKLTIMYNGHQYRQYTINITDKVAPVFTKTENVYTFEGIPLEGDYTASMFSADDNSGKVDLDVGKPKVDFNKAGEYKVAATATDPSGNKTQADAYVVVQAPEYGAMGTYVFVSIPDQHLTYFVDGKSVLDCPVVTGKINGHSTPRGTFSLNYKARNLTLKGTEDNGDKYESFVSYWMAFIGTSYGLHDATWRSNFGGNIYQYGGSHGCVNMPFASAKELYGMIEPGIPILIY